MTQLPLSFAVITALLVGAVAAMPLSAQGGEEIEVAPLPESGTTPEADKTSQQQLDEARVRELVAQELAKRERESGYLVSANGIRLLISGGINFSYNDRGNERRTAFPSDLRGSDGSAFELDQAWLALDGLYYDSNEASDFMIGQSRLKFEWEEEEFRVGEAWLMLHRPLTRFNAPFFVKEFFSDGLLLGLARPVWHNATSYGLSRGLADEALSDDEEIQVTWSAFSRWFYLFGGVSGGTVLEVEDDTQGPLNDDFLRNDRSLFFENSDDQRFVSRRLATHAGFGVAFDLAGKGDVIGRKRAFFPWQVAAQDDVLHLGLWGSTDSLSSHESTLLSGALDAPQGHGTKWRMGFNADLSLNLNPSMLLRSRLSFAYAEDGGLRRTFFSTETGLTILFGEYVPALTYLTPYFRFSLLDTSADGPQVDGSTPPAAPQITGAAIAADRWRATGGVRFGLHRHIALVVEYTVNHESFRLAAGGTNADNDLLTISLNIGF